MKYKSCFSLLLVSASLFSLMGCANNSESILQDFEMYRSILVEYNNGKESESFKVLKGSTFDIEDPSRDDGTFVAWHHPGDGYNAVSFPTVVNENIWVEAYYDLKSFSKDAKLSWQFDLYGVHDNYIDIYFINHHKAVIDFTFGKALPNLSLEESNKTYDSYALYYPESDTYLFVTKQKDIENKECPTYFRAQPNGPYGGHDAVIIFPLSNEGLWPQGVLPKPHDIVILHGSNDFLGGCSVDVYLTKDDEALFDVNFDKNKELNNKYDRIAKYSYDKYLDKYSFGFTNLDGSENIISPSFNKASNMDELAYQISDDETTSMVLSGELTHYKDKVMSCLIDNDTSAYLDIIDDTHACIVTDEGYAFAVYGTYTINDKHEYTFDFSKASNISFMTEPYVVKSCFNKETNQDELKINFQHYRNHYAEFTMVGKLP